MTARAAATTRFEPPTAGSGPLRARICVASCGLGHVARGVESWARDLAAALARRSIDVTLCKGGGAAEERYERVLPCWQRGSAAARRAAGLIPRSLGWRVGLGSPYELEQASFAWSLIGHLRRQDVDVLHVQDPLLALLIQRARAAGLVRTRTILAHGTEEPPAFLAKLDFVQHLAPFHEQACRDAGVSKPAWTTIPNFVDVGAFHPGRNDALRAQLGIPADALVALTAAAIKRSHKRIDALIEAFAGLRAASPECPAWLVVAGARDAETDELAALASGRLGGRVRFLVQHPRERMAELYRLADVFVLASLSEMMPIALLEAAASGLPCLVHRHPVLEWIVGPGGLVADLASPAAFTCAMQSLLLDADRRRALGGLARAHCVEHFGEAAVVARIIDQYRAVLAPDQAMDAPRPPRPAAPAPPTPITPAPTVSVIIPAWNSGRWVREAVQSALDQTAPPTEIIVVDDGSTDDTIEQLAPLKDRIRLVRQANQGVAAARNAGVARAAGDVIAFLDADDVWAPRKLELQLAALAEHPELGLVGAGVYDWPGQAPPSPAPHAPIARVSWRLLVVRNEIATSSIIVRREILAQVGGFDPALQGPEDHDLWLRIAEAVPIGRLETPLVGYRTTPGGLSRRPGLMETGMLRVLRKVDERAAWGRDWLLRRKAYSRCACSCAHMHASAGDHSAALARIVRSLATYPLPFSQAELRTPFARVRILSMILRRLLTTPILAAHAPPPAPAPHA